MEEIEITFPIVIMKEGKWFVASCPSLDIATQGESEQKARENMADLIDEYLSDEDTVKPNLDSIKMASLSHIIAKIPKRRKTEWENSNQLPSKSNQDS